MAVKYLLKSGNLFHFHPETDDKIAYGFFYTPDGVFLGGVLDQEAVRKKNTFEQLGCRWCESRFDWTISELNFKPFAEKLGSVSHYFMRSKEMWISDLRDCDGTDSHSNSCSERRYYYMAAGLMNCYISNKKFNLAIFIANHVALFSVKDFRKTFFTDSINQDFESEGTHYNVKTRYSNCDFKAPAYYVRAMVQNYR